MLNRMWTQTERERGGTLDGINLFFGALLGANLGSLDGISLTGYALVVLVLAGTVMALRGFAESERRILAASMLGAYVLGVSLLLYRGTPLEGLAVEDRWRLAITLAIWISSVVMTVLYPTATLKAPQAASDG
ncbi:MAG: hypothetical protein ACXW2T_10175 [Allosphingosinicella sp.]